MSTGDQTGYIRAKHEERGRDTNAKFSVDGFDKWAESELPARVGGAEKVPTEIQRMPSRIVGGVRTHSKMAGGALDLQGLIGMAQQLYDFYQKAKDYTKTVKEDLRGENIPEKYRATGKMIADTLEKIGLGKAPHVALKECLDENCEMHGGAGAVDFIKNMGQKFVTFYNWFLKYKEPIHGILKLKSLNPPGFDYPKQFSGMLSSVGLGKPCNCGGARKAPSREQLEKALRDSREGFVSPHVRSTVSAMSAIEAAKAERKRIAALKKSMRGRGEVMKRMEESDVSGPRYEEAYMNDGMSMAPMARDMGGVPARSSMAKSGMAPAASCSGGRKPSARNLIVKQIMAKHGLSLPQASKYVKEHGLY
jgi:hypothetical protein